MLLDRSAFEKELLMVFFNFPLQFKKDINRIQGFRENWLKLLFFFAESRLAILPRLLLADGLISQIFHRTQQIGTFPQFYLGIFQRISYNL
jgi:hypothetical protein